MENYPRLFIKASLIYALIGAVLGMAMAVDPSLAGRIRFVHIHLNLLGFMTMFIAGVAFHVLPRFNARPVPWPEGVKYQFYLQNTGLIGMITLYASGAVWQEGGFRVIFVLFAVSAGVGIFFMFYNLYFVLSPAKASEAPSEITGDMKVGAVLDQFPQAMPVFMQAGFTSLANPTARKTLAKVVSIEKACEKHDVDCAEFLNKLNAVLSGKPQAPSTASAPAVTEEKKSSGKEIYKGEMCQADTLVGSLIKVYPATKPVFEKHYGEGCFSCPGQAFEQVQETAHMHNVDPDLILKEINAVISENT
jgi:hypothetical protein